MKKAVKKILDWFEFIFTGKGEVVSEAISDGAVDYSGQGRDKFGK